VDIDVAKFLKGLPAFDVDDFDIELENYLIENIDERILTKLKLMSPNHNHDFIKLCEHLLCLRNRAEKHTNEIRMLFKQ